MLGLLLYCRSGFEKDLAAEVQDKASQLNVFGYVEIDCRFWIYSLSMLSAGRGRQTSQRA